MPLAVLIIEDEEVLARNLVRYLQRQSFDARSAPTAAQGITAFSEFGPDVVMLDLNLPDASGLTVLAQIRADRHLGAWNVYAALYGTPEQVYEKIMAIHQQTRNCGYVGVFSYAGMPHEEAARNMTMFAKTVMPELKKFDAGAPIDRSTMLPDLRFAAAAAE